jgi:hypothetical protein
VVCDMCDGPEINVYLLMFLIESYRRESIIVFILVSLDL